MAYEYELINCHPCHRSYEASRWATAWRCHHGHMKRVVVVGRGGAGKSTLARRLGEITGLPVVELDKKFWSPGLEATPSDRWRAVQEELVREPAWILDGDLGPYDVLDVRLRAADTVIVLDFPFVVCAWRAARRGRERADFWQWVFTYRRVGLPRVLDAIATNVRDAEVHVLRSQQAVERFLNGVTVGP